MDTVTPPDSLPPATQAKAPARPGSQGLFLIGVFEIVKTVLFIIAAAGVFHMVKRNTEVELTKLLHAFRISGDRAFIKDLLLKANVITDPGKRILTGVLLLYAGLHATEGIGLLLRKRWAEYFTVIMTAIPLPFEVYVLVHHTRHSPMSRLVPADQHLPVLFSSHVFVLKVAVLIINAGIVWYLVYHLRRGGRHGLA